MILDVHAHYFPPEYMAFIGRSDHPSREAAKLTDLTTEERIALLDRAGIDAQVLSPGQLQCYFEDRQRSRDGSLLANDLFAKFCSEHEGRFYSFGILPLPHVDDALEEMRRCLDELDMVGINLGCSIGNRQIDDPLFEPVFAELDRRGTTVFFHPVGNAFSPGLGSDYGLDWLVGAPVEDTITALRLTLSGLTDRYPNMNCIVPHLGGMVPFVFARLDRRSSDLIAALKRLYYDTVSNTTPALTCSCAAFGPSRLVFGTDYPYGNESLFYRCLDYIGEVGLDKEELAAIRGNTAASLLNIAH